MRRLQISSPQAGTSIDRRMRRWPARYAIAVGISLLPPLIGFLAGHWIHVDLLAMLLFSAMLVSSVVAGLGAGLVSTMLVTSLGFALLGDRLPAGRINLLLAEGILMSLVGGAFRSARINASERLAANLRLEQQILEIGDDERRRIGHDLHDGLGQHLTGISLFSETMSQQIEAGQQPDPAHVETITQLVSDAVRVTRDLAKSLSPVTLEREGLVAAIEELAGTASTLFGIKCVCECDDDPPLDRTRSLHLYRIVQEAVNNSVRHGKARNVIIQLSTSPRELCVTVTDDGSGLSRKTVDDPGLGLRIMEYRARMLGAKLSVERATQAGGTTVTCTCPLEDDEYPRD